MVKTRNGNVGWIKASDNRGAARINEHFRSLPKDAVSVGPPSSEPPSGSTPASTSTAEPTGGAITIPVKIERSKVLVPVTLTNGDSSATGTLVVDTGASQTMISTRMAKDLRLPAIDTQLRRGIGGSVVTGIGQVESIKVGGAEMKNMRISINDGSNGFGGEGLLGFDFLGRFNMSVDSEKKVMVLTPRAPEQAKTQ
ncbi:MAG TPA: retropepsin-like aspartic protease [Candidatus Binatia bacterium]|nr:retropepsin-like aspartic protease [Candidatus Binatia bacterium]